MKRKTEKPKQQNITTSKPVKTVRSTIEILHDITLDIRPKNETQKKLVHAIRLNDVTVCTGPAGTGKTLVSVFEALLLMKAHPELYKEIKLVKSITQLKNEEIGTLPGDEKEKLKFHMMSFLDAFHKLIGEGLTNKLIDAGMIKMEVFGAIRGRSFSNAIIIIDEFQNISHDNAKTFLTRFSDDTKVVVLGDSGQIDIKNKKDSSLETLVNKVKRFPTDGVEVVEFTEDDIVRHRLTSYFIKIFKEETDIKTPIIKSSKAKSQTIKEGEVRFFSRFLNLFK